MARAHRRGYVAAAIALAATITLAPKGSSATDEPQWTPCPENPVLSCATVTVPLDWSDPRGERIDIGIAKRPAADPASRAGALVYAPAGPGSSGVDTIANDQVVDLMFPAEVAKRFDIVSFDPRGVRRSHPVQCDSEVVARLGDQPPANQAEFDELLAVQADIGESCRELTGPLIDHLDSVNQARDLDALRAALGEEKLNVYALSYGTVLGEMYAEQFPDRIRTMILDGVVDHSADTTRIEVTGSKAAQESFEKFVGWCAESTACALHDKDVRAIVAELYARADAGTLPDPSDPSTMLSRTRLTQRILEPLGNGVVTGVADRIVELTTSKPAPAPEATEPPATVPLPIYIYCADHRSDIDSYAKLTAVNSMAETVAPDVKHGWHGVPALCVNPPFETTNPPHELDVEGAPPIMVANSRYDDSTPHENAVRVADQLDGAVLVTYDGIGHGAAPRGACMANLVTSYYVDATPPAPDTHCPSEPLP